MQGVFSICVLPPPLSPPPLAAKYVLANTGEKTWGNFTIALTLWHQLLKLALTVYVLLGKSSSWHERIKLKKGNGGKKKKKEKEGKMEGVELRKERIK